MGIFSEQLSRKNAAKRMPRYLRGLYGPAINELGVSLKTMETNAPINEREGKKEQARLERVNARSFKAAILE